MKARNITVDLPPHGVAALLLNDSGPEPESLDGSCALYYQCSVSLDIAIYYAAEFL